MNPYPFQLKAKADYYSTIREGHRSTVLRSDTGSGKTFMGKMITADILTKPNTRLLFMTHRDTIANQTLETFQAIGQPIGLIMGDEKKDSSARIQIAGVLSLPRRIANGKPEDRYIKEFLQDGKDLLVMHDEGHITGWTEAADILMALPKARHLYLTATPCRLRKDQGMGDRCTAMVSTPPAVELQAMGFLSKMRYFGSANRDEIQGKMKRAKKDASGEIQASDSAEILDTPSYNQAIVSQWRAIAPGRRTIAFTSNRDHSKNLCNAFQKVGIPAAYVDSNTPDSETDRIYEALAQKEILVICSCEKLAEGFDVPSVSCVILARRTASLAKHRQQIGRGARIFKGERWKRTASGPVLLLKEAPKTDCIVIDYAGNCAELGYLETSILWTLDKGQPLVPMAREMHDKQCKNCQAINPSSARKCLHCETPFNEGRGAGAGPGSLQELDPTKGPKKKKVSTPGPQGQTGLKKTVHTMAWQDMPKGKPPSYTWARFKKIMGFNPPESAYRHAVYGPNPTMSDFTAYLAYLTRCATSGSLDLELVGMWLEREFGAAVVAEYRADHTPVRTAPRPPTPRPATGLHTHTHSPTPSMPQPTPQPEKRVIFQPTAQRITHQQLEIPSNPRK